MFSMNTLLMLGGLVLVGCCILYGVLRIITRLSECVDKGKSPRETGKTTNGRIKHFIRYINRFEIKKS